MTTTTMNSQSLVLLQVLIFENQYLFQQQTFILVIFVSQPALQLMRLRVVQKHFLWRIIFVVLIYQFTQQQYFTIQMRPQQQCLYSIIPGVPLIRASNQLAAYKKSQQKQNLEYIHLTDKQCIDLRCLRTRRVRRCAVTSQP